LSVAHNDEESLVPLLIMQRTFGSAGAAAALTCEHAG
jgi:hypothetical protein